MIYDDIFNCNWVDPVAVEEYTFTNNTQKNTIDTNNT